MLHSSRFVTASYTVPMSMTVYAVTYMMCSNAGFAVNGINNVNISSYEKRYLLSTKQSGLVASFYDIIAGVVVCTKLSSNQQRPLPAGICKDLIIVCNSSLGL